MAEAAQQLRGPARDANRAGALRRAQRQPIETSARTGATETPQAAPRRELGTEGELQRQRTSASRAMQNAQLEQVAKSSRGGAATLDKRTGQVREGIGGASSQEVAAQMRTLRAGGTASREAAVQAKDLRSGAGTRREMQSATRGAREERQKESRAELASENKSRLQKMKSGLASLKGINEQGKEFAGLLIMRGLWGAIFPSFGHSIYLINFLYIVGFMQNFIGFTLPVKIPELGKSWSMDPKSLMAGAGGKDDGKAKLLILKLFELLIIALITLFVVAADMLFLASIGILIMLAAKVSGTPIIGGAVGLILN